MSLNNPFCWKSNPQPSIFSDDPHFTPRSNGLTVSQTSSVTSSKTVAKKTAETGRNPGTIEGLGRKTHKRDTDTAWSRSNSGVG